MRDNIRDVIVVGAGPAGLAAASRAIESVRRVLLLDDNPRAGGQIWRYDVSEPPYPEMLPWSGRVAERHVEVWNNARVFASPKPQSLLIELPDSTREIQYSQLILATGARERFLPFPGWTLPGVTGAGGLQALVKGGVSLSDKRVVVAGTGPLLLAVAAYLRRHGAKVVAVVEQAAFSAVARFTMSLGNRLGEAARMRLRLIGVPYRTSCWPVGVEGDGKLERVTLRHGSQTWTETCDYLACGFGLLPNTELPELLGCRIGKDGVEVNEFQETSVQGIYAAGEVTGVGGLGLSLVEGEIAGFAATGNIIKARQRFLLRVKQRNFAKTLARAFRLRGELKDLPQAQTIVCRCEDVTFGRLRTCSGWREGKLYTRCGMGPCQGRICGGALEFLLDWKPDSVRPPVFPVRIEGLLDRKDQ